MHLVIMDSASIYELCPCSWIQEHLQDKEQYKIHVFSFCVCVCMFKGSHHVFMKCCFSGAVLFVCIERGFLTGLELTKKARPVNPGIHLLPPPQ